MAELLERLVQNYGCEIHLYAERVEDLRIDSGESPRRQEAGALYWHKVPTIPGPHVLRFLAWMFLNGVLRRWHRWSKGASYDVLLSPGINCLHPDMVIVHALFVRLRELANEEQHRPTSQVRALRRLHRRIYYRLLVTLERRVYADKNVALAAVSQRTARLVVSNFRRDDIAVVPNGVDHRQFSPQLRRTHRGQARLNRGLREEDCVLLLVGNDWRVKGLWSVLRALATLRDLPLWLIVAGNEDPALARAEAIRLGVENRVVWPSTNDLDILELFAAADVYVSPSREDSFGLPVAEAMACGLPVITSRFAGVAELIRNGVDGFVLDDPGNVAALAATIRKLQSDLTLQRSVGAAACEAIKPWDWDRNADALWKLLQTRASGKKLI